jgi:hypothetical protein
VGGSGARACDRPGEGIIVQIKKAYQGQPKQIAEALWGGKRFPPTVRPFLEDEARVRERWDEYGLGDLWTAPVVRAGGL